MTTCNIPQKVTVIVYSAKGLKPKNKGKHRFSVIFGVGGNKFRSDVVEDLFDNPAFNTESEIDVDDPSLPLLLLVTEKQEKDVLGQVTIALGDLSFARTNRPLTVPLRPHKKCPNPEGELVLEAWISAAVVGPPPAISVTGTDGETKNPVSAGLKKLKDRVSHSPLLSRKLGDSKQHKRSHSESLFNLTTKGSASCQDLTTMSQSENRHRVLMPADSLTSLESISETAHSKKPEVNGVSPNEGPVEGGTKLTIRGTNLGLNKQDVVGLFVCGGNVLGSLEYVSSSKLICVTKAWKPCVGNVTVETQSGGKGTSLVQFTFTSRDQASDTASEVSSLSRSSSRGDADVKRNDSIKSDKTKAPAVVAEPSGLSRNLKAKSMFDLSLVPVIGKNQKPDVTGISPTEAASDAPTRLTIRGSNLGQSKADISRLVVCGFDCLASVEYESSSKIFCTVGPAKAGTGNIILETNSGGKTSSPLKFSFVERKDDDANSWAAVPYSEHETASDDGSQLKPGDHHVLEDTKLSTLRNDRTNGHSPGKLVGEIQPMRVDKKQSSSPFRAWKGKKGDKDKGLLEPHDNRYESSMYDHGNNETVDKKISELEHELNMSEERIQLLQVENKSLKDENERMRRYMESLVDRAIISCPQILCVDEKA